MNNTIENLLVVLFVFGVGLAVLVGPAALYTLTVYAATGGWQDFATLARITAGWFCICVMILALSLGGSR